MMRHPLLVQRHVDPHVIQDAGVALQRPDVAALAEVGREEAVGAPAIQAAGRVERGAEKSVLVRTHVPARNASTSAANSAWCWKRKPCAASGEIFRRAPGM